MTQLNNHLSWWLKVIANYYKDDLTLAVITISVLILAISWLLWSTSINGHGHGHGPPPLPPGPRSLPIVGHHPFLSRDLHTQFTDMARTYGPVFKFRVGAKLLVVISSPDLARAVFRDHDETFANREPPVTGVAFSYGQQDLVWSNGPYWARRISRLAMPF
ncbi:hypothetical protein OSB04_010171 [Centaurea solstitialis]|uniref:Cytochrome P450 n=1 Tax=Centaurea solstitialis TaxID=347529 RepID=A0AA38WCK5_9ASTR|nr:hypothetical protein OSB04_010171 [Centaurea solstitialis]